MLLGLCLSHRDAQGFLCPGLAARLHTLPFPASFFVFQTQEKFSPLVRHCGGDTEEGDGAEVCAVVEWSVGVPLGHAFTGLCDVEFTTTDDRGGSEFGETFEPEVGGLLRFVPELPRLNGLGWFDADEVLGEVVEHRVLDATEWSAVEEK